MCHLHAREQRIDAYAAQSIEVNEGAIHRLHDGQRIETGFIDIDDLAHLTVREPDPVAIQRIAYIADEGQTITRIETVRNEFIGQCRKDVEG